ncbi:dihydroneopterin aldolase [Viscerimonas tarda]
MRSYILLENIIIHANHGVLPQETVAGNTFVINLRIKADLSYPIKTDNVGDTINYASVLDIVKTEMARPSKLIEHAGGRIIAALKKTFPQIEEVELKLSKQNPPVDGQVEYASVILID